MNTKSKSLRSPLGKVRGLGSARHGTGHWWAQRLTALALIPLSIYFVGGFFAYVVFGGPTGLVHWLHCPIPASMLILFLAVGFHHMASGLQVIIEDYVHCACMKTFGVIAVQFGSALFAVLGILATLKILLGA